MKIETQCLHEGYKPANGEPRALPIYQSTTYVYESSQHVGDLFDLKVAGHMYSRISNPTVDAVEKKIAALEGGVGALCTSSGQMATFISIMNIAKAGDSILSVSTIYGGTVNLFSVTLKKFGIEVTFVDPRASEDEIKSKIKPNTKAIFGETLANPSMVVLDIEKFAKVAHGEGIPLIVDNTFATPYLCKPIEFGADIVVHSTSKYMDGHAVQLGGVIVDGGTFDWTSGKFEEFTVPDESYHGIVYSETFKNMAYITKARVQLMRDLGGYTTAQAAFNTNQGLETLHLRMKQHCENALEVAVYLEKHDKITSVEYPLLESSSNYELAKKYTPNGASGVISVEVKGGRDKAEKFLNSLKLASIEVHVAEVHTAVLHPATSTHRQLTSQQLIDCGITEGTIRLSVGIENVSDIISDIEQALNCI